MMIVSLVQSTEPSTLMMMVCLSHGQNETCPYLARIPITSSRFTHWNHVLGARSFWTPLQVTRSVPKQNHIICKQKDTMWKTLFYMRWTLSKSFLWWLKEDTWNRPKSHGTTCARQIWKGEKGKKIEFLLHKKQLFCFEAIACYVPVLGRRWYSVWIYTFFHQPHRSTE